MQEESRPIKAMTKAELCEAYGISKKTLAKWLKPFVGEIGGTSNRIFTPKQVAIIFEKLGEP